MGYRLPPLAAIRRLVGLLWVGCLVCTYAYGQVDTAKTGAQRRQERREQRKLERERKDSLKAAGAQDDTTTASTGLLKRLFGGKSAGEVADSAMAQSEELKGAQADYEASLRRGDYAKAKQYLEQYLRVRDSLAFAQIDIEAAALAAEAALEEKALAEKAAALAQQRASVAEDTARNQQYLLGAAGLVLLLGGGFVVVLVRSVRQKRAANALLNAKNDELAEKNEELSQAFEEIRTQQEQLEHQHRNIVESIQYARRIQEAILPEEGPLLEKLPNHFIYYKPKDIVSGDFYWFFVGPERTFLAAVDCTGHGVPGAFMSMLGMSLLNQIVRENPRLQPGEILDLLNKGIRTSLHQLGNSTTQDGMDIALVAIDHAGATLQFSGANNPMYLVRGGELEEFKGDRAPIGGSRFLEHRFSSYTLALQPGDRVYVFSDGMADQFGGPQGRKFTYKRLRELFTRQNGGAMRSQADAIAHEFDQWRGNREQIDDVLVIGIQV